MIKPETKFWHELKGITPQITWTRIENTSSAGTPDLLGYNSHSFFFTVELKVATGNKVRLSPHQISFHIRHPENTFILVAQIFQPQANFLPPTSDRLKRTATGEKFFHLFANVQATIVFSFNEDKSIFRMLNVKGYLMRRQANFVAVSNL